MTRSHTVAGIGALAFGILTIVGLGLMNPPGGTYKAHDVERYLRHGHRAAVFTGLYLEVIAALGLLLVLAYLCDRAPASTKRFAWIVGVIAASTILVGFTIMASGAIAHTYGGSGVVVAPATTYVISETGAVLVWGPGGILLGVALVLLAAGPGGYPAWVRWITLAAGILGLASPAFFPSFLLLVWAIVIGIWLLAAGGRAPEAAA